MQLLIILVCATGLLISMAATDANDSDNPFVRVIHSEEPYKGHLVTNGRKRTLEVCNDGTLILDPHDSPIPMSGDCPSSSGSPSDNNGPKQNGPHGVVPTSNPN
jgi:hypothetical protein